MAIVASLAHEILQSHCVAGQIGEGEPDITLALVDRIIHRHQQLLLTRSFPGKGQKSIPRPVAIPRRRTIEQEPLTLPNRPSPEYGKELIVKSMERVVSRFLRATDEMRRDAFSSSFELSLMEET